MVALAVSTGAASASPAHSTARTVSTASAVGTAGGPQPAAAAGRGITISTSSGTEAAPAQAAGVSCATTWNEYWYYQIGNLVFTWKASTYYCWNGVIVTYHSTSYYWSTTSFGHLVGIGFQDGYVAFHCYVASGSRTNCSGNDEQTVGAFGTNTGTIGGGAGIDVDINQWQNYHGQAFSSITTWNY